MAYSIHRELSVIGFGGSSHGEIDIELTDTEQYEIYRELEKQHRYEDVVWRLAEMSEEKWFRLTEDPDTGKLRHYNEIVARSIAMIEKMLDANVPYNDTVFSAIREAIEECDPEALK